MPQNTQILRVSYHYYYFFFCIDNNDSRDLMFCIVAVKNVFFPWKFFMQISNGQLGIFKKIN